MAIIAEAGLLLYLIRLPCAQRINAKPPFPVFPIYSGNTWLRGGGMILIFEEMIVLIKTFSMFVLL